MAAADLRLDCETPRSLHRESLLLGPRLHDAREPASTTRVGGNLRDEWVGHGVTNGASSVAPGCPPVVENARPEAYTSPFIAPAVARYLREAEAIEAEIAARPR